MLNSVGFKDRQLNQFKSTVEKKAAKAVSSAIKVAKKYGVKVDTNKLNKMSNELTPILEEKVDAYSNTVAESFKMGQDEAAVMMKTQQFVDQKNMVQEATFEKTFETLEENYLEGVKNIKNPTIKRVLNNEHLRDLASEAKAQMKETSGLKGNIVKAAATYKKNGVKVAKDQRRKYLGPQKMNAALSKVTKKLGKINL